VPTDSIELLPQEARLYEPRLALDGGRDGLDLQRKVTKEAPHWLAPGGHLLVETSAMQVTQTLEIFANAGLTTKIARDEELDATVVIGTNSGKE
jgi:release factor glutamine methyltransferase